MSLRPWDPEAVALRRAERRQRRAGLIAGAAIAVVIVVAAVAAVVGGDDDPEVRATGSTEPAERGSTTATVSTVPRRSTTTAGRSTTTNRAGSSTSSLPPTTPRPTQGATTVVGPTTIGSTTDSAPSPSRVPPTGDAPTTTTSTPATSSAPPGTPDRPVPLGTQAPIGDGWELRVDGFTPDATKDVLAADEFGKPPRQGFQYALALVSATYTGPESSASAFDLDIGALGPSDVEADMFSCDAFPPDELDTGAEVAQGATITGNVCFALATEDAASVVLYATASYTGADVYFAVR